MVYQQGNNHDQVESDFNIHIIGGVYRNEMGRPGTVASQDGASYQKPVIGTQDSGLLYNWTEFDDEWVTLEKEQDTWTNMPGFLLRH
jgi:hypothetical protein